MVTVHGVNVELAYQGIIVANNVFGALKTCMKFVVHRNCSGVDVARPYRILVLNAHICVPWLHGATYEDVYQSCSLKYRVQRQENQAVVEAL